MGMAASQLMLLQLTSRSNTIGLELSRLSNEKVSLTRDMQRISREYQESLSDKILKWSNNGGVSYIDLSYQNLMKPSSMNQNNPYLLTDSSDRIVVDPQYKKYAEMISENGSSGDWESVRTQVLSELIGIDPEKIDNASAYQEEIWANEAVINSLIEAEQPAPTKIGTEEKLFEYAGMTSTGISNNFSKGDSWAAAYKQGATIDLGTASEAAINLQNILNTIYEGIAPYLDEDCQKILEDACDAFMTDNKARIDGDDKDDKTSLEAEHTAIGGSSKNYTVNVTHLINYIFSELPKVSTASGNQNLEWLDKNSTDYTKWEEHQEQWEKQYEEAKNDYDESVARKNQLFTGNEEALIKFYDAIFSAIAEKGWTSNAQVNDTDYLNQMLQNGQYTLTTVDRDLEQDSDGAYLWDNDYLTDIASNFKNIFMVNDSSAREEALVKYEHEKSIINAKETKIDTRMQNLETEQAAIKQMIQGIEQVKNDNIENNMKIFA